uniref:Uncharacterized protein n=1 Tax=Opuntia streptacantha TaxID=393608 RepID=A0A7C8ZCG2_OPUST
MGLSRPTKADDCDLRAHNQDTGSTVVLSDVLGQTEDCAPSVAALLVEHESLHRWLESEEFGELVVGPRHVYPGGSAEDDMRDLRPWLTPLFYGLNSSLFTQSRHLSREYVLSGVQGWSIIVTHVRVLFQHFF